MEHLTINLKLRIAERSVYACASPPGPFPNLSKAAITEKILDFRSRFVRASHLETHLVSLYDLTVLRLGIPLPSTSSSISLKTARCLAEPPRYTAICWTIPNIFNLALLST